MFIKFSPSIGVPSANRISLSGGRLINSGFADAPCLFWTGQGDLYLCADVPSGRITGLCGQVRPERLNEVDVGELCSTDGSVAATAPYRLFGGEFICCDLAGAGKDRARGALVLGSPQSGDMIMRVADNLFVCLDGDSICAVIADDIFPAEVE